MTAAEFVETATSEEVNRWGAFLSYKWCETDCWRTLQEDMHDTTAVVCDSDEHFVAQSEVCYFTSYCF